MAPKTFVLWDYPFFFHFAAEDDPVQKDAQELCVKQHSMGFTHLMVGNLGMSFFWGGSALSGTTPSQIINSGQIIATSHDLTPNGGLVRAIPLFQGNLGWWNIIIWPD